MGLRTWAALAVSETERFFSISTATSRHSIPQCCAAVAADALRLAHQILVDDLVQPAAEHGAPVLDEARVGGVVAAEVGEVVAERIARAKERAEHREAAVERRAAHEDDARLGKRREDRTRVEIIEQAASR